MTNQNLVLKCRKCQIDAEAEEVNGDIHRITCPSCGVFVEGDAARNVLAQQARAYAEKKLSDMLRRATSRNKAVEYRAGRLRDSGGPFVLR